MPTFIDTHTHLYLEEFSNDINDVVKKAVDVGVKYMLMPNVDEKTVSSMAGVWEKFPDNCLPMMALHPTSVKPGFENILEKMKLWFYEKSMVAVGETGIDLYWDKSHYKEQVESFQTHIEWALEFNLPIVIHSRNSVNEIMDVLEGYRGKGLTGVMHCFPGNAKEADWFTDFGFLLGIGGVVTYKNSMMARVVEHVGLNHIILETDAPYLTPVPHRGKRNQPVYIPVIAQKIAELKNTSIETVAEQTTGNACKLFNLKL
jgi:TatD DNase family protein